MGDGTGLNNPTNETLMKLYKLVNVIVIGNMFAIPRDPKLLDLLPNLTRIVCSVPTLLAFKMEDETEEGSLRDDTELFGSTSNCMVRLW